LPQKNALLKYDRFDMRRSLENWPEFVRRALSLSIDLPDFPRLANTVILGMGTPNAVGGILEPWSRVPLIAIDDWTLPLWVGKETLVLALSYSGNTGEVLATTEQSLEREANIIAISSGGKLHELGTKKSFPTITFEPVGRSGHSFPYLFLLSGRVLNRLGLLDFNTDSKKLIETLKAIWVRQDWIDIGELLNRSRQLVVCGGQNIAGLVTWLKHCLNENAKKIVIPLIVPEANHGEVEAFTELDSNDAIIILRERSSETEWTKNPLRHTKRCLPSEDYQSSN